MGGQASLARAIKVTPQTLRQWLKGERPIPRAKCIAIEQVTKGKVVAESLLLGGWARIPDTSWPHPAGRPVFDIAQGFSLSEVS